MEKAQTTASAADACENFAEAINNIFNSLPRARQLAEMTVSDSFSCYAECSGNVMPFRHNALSAQERKDLLDSLKR